VASTSQLRRFAEAAFHSPPDQHSEVGPSPVVAELAHMFVHAIRSARKSAQILQLFSAPAIRTARRLPLRPDSFRAGFGPGWRRCGEPPTPAHPAYSVTMTARLRGHVRYSSGLRWRGLGNHVILGSRCRYIRHGASCVYYVSPSHAFPSVLFWCRMRLGTTRGSCQSQLISAASPAKDFLRCAINATWQSTAGAATGIRSVQIQPGD